MTTANTRWTRDPGHTYCRLCTIRLDHSAVPVATTDPTLCADCEKRHATRPAAEPMVTIDEAAQMLGVTYGIFYIRFRPLLEAAGKAQGRVYTRYLFRRADVEQIAARYAVTGD